MQSHPLVLPRLLPARLPEDILPQCVSRREGPFFVTIGCAVTISSTLCLARRENGFLLIEFFRLGSITGDFVFKYISMFVGDVVLLLFHAPM